MALLSETTLPDFLVPSFPLPTAFARLTIHPPPHPPHPLPSLQIMSVIGQVLHTVMAKS